MDVNNYPAKNIETAHLDPIVGVNEVTLGMMSHRNKLPEIGLTHQLPFAAVYLGVTQDVADTQHVLFRQPKMLDRATGIFYSHYSKQTVSYQQGNPVEPHWEPLYYDERVKHVDDGTLLSLGMIAHIGGDLARTVYEARTDDERANNEYIDFDYNTVNYLLLRRAHVESNKFVLPRGPEAHNSFLENRARKKITDIAVHQVVRGRDTALKDYYRLVKASSEDERQAIIEKSHQRIAKMAYKLLSLSYAAHTASRGVKGLLAPEQEAISTQLADDRRIAKFLPTITLPASKGQVA